MSLWNHCLDQNTNENFDSFCPGPFRAEIIKFFVGILVQTKTSKRHFEINWPLADSWPMKFAKIKENLVFISRYENWLEGRQRNIADPGWKRTGAHQEGTGSKARKQNSLRQVPRVFGTHTERAKTGRGKNMLWLYSHKLGWNYFWRRILIF